MVQFKGTKTLGGGEMSVFEVKLSKRGEHINFFGPISEELKVKFRFKK